MIIQGTDVRRSSLKSTLDSLCPEQNGVWKHNLLCGHSNRFSLPRLAPWHVHFLSGETQTVRSHHEIFISPRPLHCSTAWQSDRITRSLNLATLAAKFGSFHRQSSQTEEVCANTQLSMKIIRKFANLLTNHQVVWVCSSFTARSFLQNSIFTSVLRFGSEFSTLAQIHPRRRNFLRFLWLHNISHAEGLGSLSCFRAARTLNNPELSTYSISIFFSRTFSKIIPRTAVNLKGLGRGFYRAFIQLHPCVLDVRVGIVHFNCVLIYIPCREDVFWWFRSWLLSLEDLTDLNHINISNPSVCLYPKGSPQLTV